MEEIILFLFTYPFILAFKEWHWHSSKLNGRPHPFFPDFFPHSKIFYLALFCASHLQFLCWNSSRLTSPLFSNRVVTHCDFCLHRFFLVQIFLVSVALITVSTSIALVQTVIISSLNSFYSLNTDPICLLLRCVILIRLHQAAPWRLQNAALSMSFSWWNIEMAYCYSQIFVCLSVTWSCLPHHVSCCILWHFSILGLVCSSFIYSIPFTCLEYYPLYFLSVTFLS